MRGANVPKTPHHPDIDRVFAHAVAQKTCSGAAAILSMPLGTQGLSVVHREVYGRTHFDSRVGHPITTQTLFDLGELTFSLGPVMLTLLWASAGKLDVRKPLGVLLPELRTRALGAVTLSELLDETSGLEHSPELLARVQSMAPAPVRPRARAVDEPFVAKPKWRSAHAEAAATPIDAALRARIRTLFLSVEPSTQKSRVTQHTSLNALVLGLVLETLGKKPLGELLRREVFSPLHVTRGFNVPEIGPEGVYPRRIGSTPFDPSAATLLCPWRHRILVSEPSDPIAWLWGGLMGHSGLFATLEGVHALLVGLVESFRGMPSLLKAGVLKRFWTRSQHVVQPTTTLGFVVPSRDNGMIQSRWSQQSVGQIAQEGCAFFIDLSSGSIGIVLTNLLHADGLTDEKRRAWSALRLRAFDAMAQVSEEMRSQPGTKSRSTR